jgi:hypothetical protein
LSEKQEARLIRKAKRLGRTPSEVGALLIEEGLRRDEFAFIDFRDSPVGRQAYIQGSTLAVWEVVWLARHYKNSIQKTACHLEVSPLKIQAALNYFRAFPDEIEGAVTEQTSDSDFDSLSRLLPQAEVFRLSEDT